MLKACTNINAEVFVVDNGSSDGSREFFRDRFPAVKFIWQKENTGFAKANNKALQLAAGEKILFLNPDTIVPADCFEKCLHFFSTTAGIGSLGVKMIDGSGSYLPESKRGFPTWFISFCKIAGLTRIFPHSKLFAGYYLGNLAENETNEVDVLPGAFMMVDKKVLNITGGFDEKFFMYGEDIDLSYRIQKAGFKNYYFPHTAIIHFKGESTQKQSKEYLQHFYGAMILFTKKHFGNFSGYLYQAMIHFILTLKLLLNRNNKIYRERITDKRKLQQNHAVIFCETSEYEKHKEQLQDYFYSIEYADNIKQLKPGCETVIFCEPFVSFAEIISLMETHHKKYLFFIQAGSTHSMVGSADKTMNGQVIITRPS